LNFTVNITLKVPCLADLLQSFQALPAAMGSFPLLDVGSLVPPRS
jgi:hypothetical protein